jgi:hypothetical protein
MKELFRQRQRELAAERAQFREAAPEEDVDENAPPKTDTEPKLEQLTMPPPPKVDEEPPSLQPKPETPAPKVEAPPPAVTRPREADPTKKKGKKGGEEP